MILIINIICFDFYISVACWFRCCHQKQQRKQRPQNEHWLWNLHKTMHEFMKSAFCNMWISVYENKNGIDSMAKIHCYRWCLIFCLIRRSSFFFLPFLATIDHSNNIFTSLFSRIKITIRLVLSPFLYSIYFFFILYWTLNGFTEKWAGETKAPTKLTRMFLSISSCVEDSNGIHLKKQKSRNNCIIVIKSVG